MLFVGNTNCIREKKDFRKKGQKGSFNTIVEHESTLCCPTIVDTKARNEGPKQHKLGLFFDLNCLGMHWTVDVFSLTKRCFSFTGANPSQLSRASPEVKKDRILPSRSLTLLDIKYSLSIWWFLKLCFRPYKLLKIGISVNLALLKIFDSFCI